MERKARGGDLRIPQRRRNAGVICLKRVASGEAVRL
jgi:hypothetical protein